MFTNNKRKSNVNNIKNLLNNNLIIFPAIIGKNIDTKNIQQYHPKLLFNFDFTFVNEIGCYLSHFYILQEIIEIIGYTVILEDDIIIENNIENDINNIISKIDINFDILFLSNLIHENHGLHYKDNIYYVDPNNLLWGTSAYIINNKNVKKIINLLYDIDLPIDTKYKRLINEKKLIGLILFPNLINVDESFESTIRNSNLTKNTIVKSQIKYD